MGLPLQSDLARLERSSQDIMRWQKAREQLVAGRPALALAAYRELVNRFPGVVNLWVEYGAAAAADLGFSLANEALARAEEMAVQDAAVLVALGQQHHRMRQPERARACFERAVKADPSSIHARLSWAAWLERERRLEEAWEQTERCLALHPGDSAALYYRAFLHHRQDRNGEAETALRDLLKSDPREANVRVSCLHLLGVVLDEAGQYAEAIEWLLKAKAAVRQTNNVAPLEQAYDKAARQRRSLLARLTPEMVRRWRSEAPCEPFPHKLALLGGHPRSGTTLLEQILGAHPSIRAVDESEAFVVEVGDKLAPPPPFPPLGVGALDGLGAARRAEMRRRYRRSLLREEPEGPAPYIVIDKNPSPTASLHLWLRVFPESKVLIALRDPRDVVVSCFFQNLALTPVNVNFLSLERAVGHYADLMDVWLRMRELGGFDWIETRYEDIVADVEKEGRRVTEFLGLSWHPAQANCHEAAGRKLVFSPTYSEVAQPVHNRAVGRWKHYAAALEPFQQRLSSYVRALGYGEERG